MTRFYSYSIILFTLVVTSCFGFDFSMERKNFTLKGQSYCGLLRCQVDTITENKVSSLIKMDIYYLNNRSLLATILSKDPEIQSHTRKTVNVTGSMSDHHGELRLYFTETADCLEAHFICRINFFLASGQTDFSEKSTVNYSRGNDGHDLYMKSQISYEQTISDPSGLILNNLMSPDEFLKNRMGFSFQTGNFDSSTPEKDIEVTKNSLMSQRTKHDSDIKKVLSDVESSMAHLYEFSMTELYKNYTSFVEHQESIEMQHIEKMIQELNDIRLVQIDNKVNEMIKKVNVCTTIKALIQSNNEHVELKHSFDYISNKLEDLWTSQKAVIESLANSSIKDESLKLEEKQLKCERGMGRSLNPREVMSLYNKQIQCDTKTDGGGWIIIQRRVKSGRFPKVSWRMYKEGFGSFDGDYWLGLDFISSLTQMNDYMLRIDMTKNGVDSHVVFGYFILEDESLMYTLRVADVTSKNSEILKCSRDQTFTIMDRDEIIWGYDCDDQVREKLVFPCKFTPERHSSSKNDFIHWGICEEISLIEIKIRKKRRGRS